MILIKSTRFKTIKNSEFNTVNASVPITYRLFSTNSAAIKSGALSASIYHPALTFVIFCSIVAIPSMPAGAKFAG